MKLFQYKTSSFSLVIIVVSTMFSCAPQADCSETGNYSLGIYPQIGIFDQLYVPHVSNLNVCQPTSNWVWNEASWDPKQGDFLGELYSYNEDCGYYPTNPLSHKYWYGSGGNTVTYSNYRCSVELTRYISTEGVWVTARILTDCEYPIFPYDNQIALYGGNYFVPSNAVNTGLDGVPVRLDRNLFAVGKMATVKPCE